jgi:hypothetical protein
MNLKDLPRSAVGGALKVVRIPVDAVLDRAPANRLTAKARELFDRTDASTRGAAGEALDDEQLRRESRLGRVAAEERAEASELRSKASEKAQRAAETAEERKQAAEERAETEREEAAESAADARRLKDAAERAKEERKAEEERVEGSRGAPPR